MSIQSVLDYPDISFIDNMTLTELKTQMREKFIEVYKENTGREPDLSYTSRNSLLLDATALIIYQSILKIDNQGKMNTLKYATGDYLDNLGALKGVTRKEAEAATTTLRFSMDAARSTTTPISAGVTVTPGDGVYFKTTEYAEIAIGATYADVKAKCTVTGTKGNGYDAGEIKAFVDAVPFISAVSNITTSEGGSETQTDDEYRENIYEAPNGYTCGGSEQAYAWLCKEYSTLIDEVSVSSPSDNKIEIRYLLKNGELPGEEMNSGLLEYLNESDRKLLNDLITVSAPDTAEYDIDLTYYIARSAKNKAEEIQKNVEAAIDEYILWQRSSIGRDINPSVLISRIVQAGAIRAEVTSPARQVLDDISIGIVKNKNIVYGGIEDD